MNGKPVDPMWPEFQPLWKALREAGDPVLVAGGYGLLLKQSWLLADPTVSTVVQLDRWRDASPRVTRDLDLVIALDLIASVDAQARLAGAMAGRGFVVTTRNPRWQFTKRLGEDRAMLVEFHSRLPPPDSEHLQIDKVRVKHKPSLGEGGIHGRQNAEAVGCDHHPFGFELEGISITVPNPVAWCLMKLAAMRDRWEKGEEAHRPEEDRAFHRGHAIKHAQDVCRAVAMATRAEADLAAEVIDRVRPTSAYPNVVDACGRFFGGDGGWGTLVVAGMWRDDDLRLIRDVLARWFH